MGHQPGLHLIGANNQRIGDVFAVGGAHLREMCADELVNLVSEEWCHHDQADETESDAICSELTMQPPAAVG